MFSFESLVIKNRRLCLADWLHWQIQIRWRFGVETQRVEMAGKTRWDWPLTSYMSTDVTYLGLFEYMTKYDKWWCQLYTIRIGPLNTSILDEHEYGSISSNCSWSVVSLQDLLALYDWNVLCAPVWCSLMTLTWFINKRGMYLLISHTMSLMYSSFFLQIVHAYYRIICVFPKIMLPPNHPFFIGCSIINNPFWGTTIFGNPHMRTQNLTELHTCSPNVRLEVEG